MKLNKQGILAAAIGASLLAMATFAQTQERTEPRTTSRTAAKQEGGEDRIVASACFMNLVDRRTVAAGRGGILASVTPEEGIIVKAGQQVAKVKDEVAAAQFATADKQATNDIEIRFGQKSAEVAQVEWMQSVKSNSLVPGTVGEIELRRLKLAFERAELQIENARKEHEVAGLKRDEAGELLQTHVVESPIDGMVTKVHKRTGEAVREGDAIIDVVNMDRVRVSGYVPFKDVNRIRLGDKVVVKLEVPDAELAEEELRFEGRITFIDLSVTKSKTPEVKIFAEVVNRDGVLKDQATAAMVVYPRKAFSPANATTKRDVPRRPNVDE